jgi:hypothetical protein
MFVKTAGLLVIPAAVAALAGCGSSAQQSQPDAAPAGTAVAQAAQAPQGGSAARFSFTAVQLRRGLLGHINGTAPVTPAQAGPYSSLADVKASKKSMHGVVVSPAKCAQASATGLTAKQLASAPSAIEDFRVGQNGVSEVLMAASGAAASSALGREVPLGCSHYSAVFKGKKYTYAVKDSWVRGIGDRAHIVNVKTTSGRSRGDAWTIAYRGHGIVGSITVDGPDASEAAVRQLGKQSYTYAVSRLS